MTDLEFDTTKQDRIEEIMAVINMIGYAMGIAKELGVPDAAADLQSAGLKLALEVQSDLSSDCTGAEIIELSKTAAGTC